MVGTRGYSDKCATWRNDLTICIISPALYLSIAVDGAAVLTLHTETPGEGEDNPTSIQVAASEVRSHNHELNGLSFGIARFDLDRDARMVLVTAANENPQTLQDDEEESSSFCAVTFQYSTRLAGPEFTRGKIRQWPKEELRRVYAQCGSAIFQDDYDGTGSNPREAVASVVYERTHCVCAWRVAGLNGAVL